MNRAKAIEAVEEGIYEKIKALAAQAAANEITEDATVAESQFARGLGFAKDALDRCRREVETIFDP